MSFWTTIKDLISNIFNGPPDTQHLSAEQLQLAADHAGADEEWLTERVYNDEALKRMLEERAPPSDAGRQEPESNPCHRHEADHGHHQRPDAHRHDADRHRHDDFASRHEDHGAHHRDTSPQHHPDHGSFDMN